MPSPDSPYAVSKWAAEKYLHTIGSFTGIETVALRIFNAYGPLQQLPVSHAPVVPRFLQQVVTGGSLVIFGDGTQSRDFVSVIDVVEALVKSATAPAEQVNRQVLNIGSGVETTMNDLADLVESATGRSANRIYNRAKASGVQRLVADIRLAQDRLDFQPRTGLLAGLKQILAEDLRFSRVGSRRG